MIKNNTYLPLLAYCGCFINVGEKEGRDKIGLVVKEEGKRRGITDLNFSSNKT